MRSHILLGHLVVFGLLFFIQIRAREHYYFFFKNSMNFDTVSLSSCYIIYELIIIFCMPRGLDWIWMRKRTQAHNSQKTQKNLKCAILCNRNRRIWSERSKICAHEFFFCEYKLFYLPRSNLNAENYFFLQFNNHEYLFFIFYIEWRWLDKNGFFFVYWYSYMRGTWNYLNFSNLCRVKRDFI